MNSKSTVAGIFHAKLKRDGKIIDEWDSPNRVVLEGRTVFNQSTLGAIAPLTTWYVGIYANARSPIDSDTGETVSGLSGELNLEYDEPTRPVWVPDSSITDTISNSATPAVFTINTTAAINGAFLVSENTKGGAVVGTKLMGESLFPATRNVLTGDQVIITYEITLAST